MRNAIQRTEAYHWLNDGAATVKSGALVPLGGSLCGIAVADVPPGRLGALEMDGVYWVAAVEAEDIPRGSILNFDSATGELSAVNAGDAPGAAMAWVTKVAGERRIQAALRAGGYASGGAAVIPLPINPRTVTGAATDDSDLVTAFNAEGAMLPPATTSSVVYWHQGATPYLYQGARGAPAVAASAADFLPLSVAGGPTRHAVLTITQSVTDGVFDVTAGGAFYTHDGPDADGTLGATAAAFAADENTDVLNEVGGSVKPDVVWLSPTTFRYPGRLDPPDRLQVQMQ